MNEVLNIYNSPSNPCNIYLPLFIVIWFDFHVSFVDGVTARIYQDSLRYTLYVFIFLLFETYIWFPIMFQQVITAIHQS